MKITLILLLTTLLSFACEHFADYRYEIVNHTSKGLRIKIELYDGPIRTHVDSVRAFTTSQVFSSGSPIVLGCNEDSPQDRGFEYITSFVVSVIDSSREEKDFKDNSRWAYRIEDRTGIYSLSITDSSFSK